MNAIITRGEAKWDYLHLSHSVKQIAINVPLAMYTWVRLVYSDVSKIIAHGK